MRDRVINVCFHGVGEPARQLEPGELNYWIDRDGYRTVLDEISTWPSVSVSFDDGNASDVDVALGGLLDHRLSATFFVVADRIDKPGSLSTEQLRTLVRCGMRVGTHGMHHQPWTETRGEARSVELEIARGLIADAAGTFVDEAACPLGRYDRSVLDDLSRLGYARVYTSDRRAATRGMWLQPRFSVRRGDDADSFRAHVAARCRSPRHLAGVAVGVLKQLR